MQAFAWLNLTSVTIPASVRIIEYSAFGQTNPISRVTFEGDNTKLESEKEWYVKLRDYGSGSTEYGPFEGNLHEVYWGRGTYIRGSDGKWTREDGRTPPPGWTPPSASTPSTAPPPSLPQGAGRGRQQQ